jgi:hypothetical protein
VTWLVPEPSDKEALLYFARSGHTPDVVFVDDTDIKQEGGYDKAPATDPMLAFTLANYRRADHVANFSVYVRR